MSACGGVLMDEKTRAVLAFIQSTVPPREAAYQREVERESRSRK